MDNLEHTGIVPYSYEEVPFPSDWHLLVPPPYCECRLLQCG
jgi:hypothetical protein